MSESIVSNFHANALRTFRDYKAMVEKAIEQISDDEFFAAIDPESNSIAVIVKHVAGNLVSRWTDFLTTDGEKPDRDRDTEFEVIADTRASLMEFWHRGWQTLFDNVEPLAVADFERKVTIRGEPYTVVEAVTRNLAHTASHVGQIVFLAKHFRSGHWETLSIARGRSGEFNQSLGEKLAVTEMKADSIEDPRSPRRD